MLKMEAEADMTWTTPVITEICIGMEVTSYLSAEI
ncbi:MAG: pyrroloquinoline quinone precursor peptide PqqA [Methylocella sp.]|jgi:coenzyme PQQ precursor peptide PqqA